MVSPAKRSWPQEHSVKRAKAQDDHLNKTGLGLWASLSSLDREAYRDLSSQDWLKILHKTIEFLQTNQHQDYVGRTYKNVIYTFFYHLKDKVDLHEDLTHWIEIYILTAPFHNTSEDLGPCLTALADKLYIERNPLYRLLTKLGVSTSMGELEKLAFENNSDAFIGVINKRSHTTHARIANVAAKRLSYMAIKKVVAITDHLSPKIVHQIIKNNSLSFIQRTQIFALMKGRVTFDYVSPKGRAARDQFVRFSRLECFNHLALVGTEESKKPELISHLKLVPVNFSILEPPQTITKSINDYHFIRYIDDCVQSDRYALSFCRMRQAKKESDPIYDTLLLKQIGHIFSVKDEVTVEGVLTKTDFFVPYFSRVYISQELEGLADPEFKLTKEMIDSVYDSISLDEDMKRSLHAKLLNPIQNVPIVILSRFKAHARYIIFFKELFILCDKDGINPGFTVYSHPKNLTFELLENLFSVDESSQLSHEAIVARLELEYVLHVPMSRQKANICTRSSLNMAIYALLCIFNQVDFSTVDMEKMKRASQLYKKWKAFATVQMINTVIEEGHHFLAKPTFPRKPLVYTYLHYPYLKLVAKPQKLAPILPLEKAVSVVNHLRWLLNRIADVKTS